MEPFFTTKGPGKGTGLGLSVVHGIAEQSGGWFNLRSRKGEGTTAELWLPVAEGLTPAIGRSERQANEPVVNQASLDILRQRGPVDLVITDYAMPHMTGLQLVNAIKQEWPELPVIIATGFAEMDSEVQSGLPKLAKPFTEVELAKELERIVPGKRDGGRVPKLRIDTGSTI